MKLFELLLKLATDVPASSFSRKSFRTREAKGSFNNSGADLSSKHLSNLRRNVTTICVPISAKVGSQIT